MSDTDQLLEEARRRLAELEEANDELGDLVFPTAVGARTGPPTGPWCEFLDTRARAGLRGTPARLHDLRHYAVSP